MALINVHLSVDEGGPAVTQHRVIPATMRMVALRRAWDLVDPDRVRLEPGENIGEVPQKDGGVLLDAIWALAKNQVDSESVEQGGKFAERLP
jgi:hypothetical protein